MEALARFNQDPARSPDMWFAEAAELGMQIPLERTAFQAALNALDELPTHMFLSTNLSPATIVTPGFWEHISHDITRRLVLEITEHAAVDDYEALHSVLYGHPGCVSPWTTSAPATPASREVTEWLAWVCCMGHDVGYGR